MNKRLKYVFGAIGRILATILIASYYLAFTWGAYIVRFFNATLLGAFTLAVILYYSSPRLFGVRPLLLPTGLIDWFSNLPLGDRSAVVTALLTTVGFMAAFWSSQAAWQRQAVITTRAYAADDIVDRLMRATHAANDIFSYVSLLRLTISAARLMPINATLLSSLQYQAQRISDFFAMREEFRVAHQALTEIQTRHANVLVNSVGLEDRVAQAVKHYGEAVFACFQVSPPTSNPGAPSFVQDFLAQVNDAALFNTESKCKAAMDIGGALLGFVQAQLRYGMQPPTLAGVINSTRHLPQNVRVFTTIFPTRKRP